MTNAPSKVDLARSMLATPITGKSMEELAALLDKWLTDDLELHYPGRAPIPFARVWRGRQGFQEFMGAFGASVDTKELSVGEIKGDGDVVFTTGRTVGVVRANAREYVSDWMLVWTFRGDKICKMVEYHDTQAMAEAFAT